MSVPALLNLCRNTIPYTDFAFYLLQMIKNHCPAARSQMRSILKKTLSLTHEYMNQSPTNATKLLSEHSATFQVQTDYRILFVWRHFPFLRGFDNFLHFVLSNAASSTPRNLKTSNTHIFQVFYGLPAGVFNYNILCCFQQTVNKFSTNMAPQAF